MLGYLAVKALICGRMWFVSWCLSLCLESMASGSCSQHIESINECRMLLKVFRARNTIELYIWIKQMAEKRKLENYWGFIIAKESNVI